jgi:glycosyltransferase involved in cell wall biosynthesis
MSRILSLSVIVPAYNEELNLTSTVIKAEAMLGSLINGQLEWILVDDGSTDSTWHGITNLSHSMPNVIALRHTINKGLGAAICTGSAVASSEWCTWIPADGQIEPQAIADMLRLESAADLVLLMRARDDRPWQRRVITSVMHGLIRILLGFDINGYSGVFLVRRDILQSLSFHGKTSAQNLAIVMHCRKNGYRIKKIPTMIQPRMSGTSKVANFRTMLMTLYEIMMLRLVTSLSRLRTKSSFHK